MLRLNNEIVKITKFPNGETHIANTDIERILSNMADTEVIPFEDYTNIVNPFITFKFESNEDLINLIFLTKHMRSLHYGRLNLIIQYMPYSRMDRTEGKKVFTLKYITEIINNLKFNKVYILEPHSDVSVALINNSKEVWLTPQLFKDYKELIGFDKDKDLIYYPDGSSYKRYSKFYEGYNSIIGFKHRDFETGHITSIEFAGNKINKESKIVMVDDLCSGGMTFKIAGDIFRRDYGITDEITLITGHCEYNIFNGAITKDDSPVNRIITTNSIIEDEAKGIKQKFIIANLNYKYWLRYILNGNNSYGFKIDNNERK